MKIETLSKWVTLEIIHIDWLATVISDAYFIEIVEEDVTDDLESK